MPTGHPDSSDPAPKAATFSELGLSPTLLESIREAGYEHPTPIQAQVIPSVLAGRDVLGIARTGSGKTAGFTLPMLERLARSRARARMPRALILEPTRELAAQVIESLEMHGRRHRLSTALIIGGVGMKQQQALLESGVDILVATPGRLLDLFGRGRVLLAATSFLVIDEADRMLDMGFIPDVEKIVRLLPRSRQTLLFSATLPPEIKNLARQFLKEPEEVYADEPQMANSSVSHDFKVVMGGPHAARRTLLESLQGIGEESLGSALVFCNRKVEVSDLEKFLLQQNYNVGALHGDLAQPVRTRTLNAFREGKIQILVCSDVAARGLDIPEVLHVFNFDLPKSADDYVHRIGRTGRAGRTGHAITFLKPGDGRLLADLEKILPEGGFPKEITAASLDGDDETDTRGRGNGGSRASSPRRGRDNGRGRSDNGGGRGRDSRPAPRPEHDDDSRDDERPAAHDDDRRDDERPAARDDERPARDDNRGDERDDNRSDERDDNRSDERNDDRRSRPAPRPDERSRPAPRRARNDDRGARDERPARRDDNRRSRPAPRRDDNRRDERPRDDRRDERPASRDERPRDDRRDDRRDDNRRSRPAPRRDDRRDERPARNDDRRDDNRRDDRPARNDDRRDDNRRDERPARNEDRRDDNRRDDNRRDERPARDDRRDDNRSDERNDDRRSRPAPRRDERPARDERPTPRRTRDEEDDRREEQRPGPAPRPDGSGNDLPDFLQPRPRRKQ